MADIVSLHGDEHQQVQSILPWYATGRLDPAEAGAVEQHLQTCAACREDLELERELARCVAQQGFDANVGWRSLRQRIVPRSAPTTRKGIATTIRHWLAWPTRLGWFLGAQAVMAVAVMIVAMPGAPRPEYHTLSNRTAPPAGNVIVMFRPDTTEAGLRNMLEANHARIVDGPNAAGAYVLNVPPPDRDAVLSHLRAQPAIMLAQPIDTGTEP